ncbi:MAG: dephospho-CoA kinase [Planctomycetes bacterium]|nr:dephospho-CoA kinase [Planctomycetota bacterium]MCG2682579.1 dephospho-CoA kinase [Planctomycetales bacterium]
MRIIGITGGVASGKSTVARLLEKLGAGVLDADRAGHEALRLPQVEAAARRRWGEKIFGPDGRIDRSSLARIVFAPGPEGRKERLFLEQLTHPEIARLFRLQADVLEKMGVKVVVLDAPLLLEAGWKDLCDKIVFVEAPWEARLSRALARGWDKEDFDARDGAQESLQHKRECADVIIDNSGSPERTQAQVERFWASLLR